MPSMKNHVREALFTAALFGSVAALASTPADARNVTPAQTPKVSGHGSVDASAAKKTGALAFVRAIFTKG